ncbi:MAG: trigger factor, partial [Microcoleaceae cyanobacterium]
DKFPHFFDVKKFFVGDRVEQMRQESRPQALEILRQGLALQAIGQQENITVDDQEIAAEVQELVREFAEDGETIDVKKVREFVRENQMKEKTLKWLEEKATIELLPAGSLQKAEDTTGETDISETSEVAVEATVIE